MPWSLHKASAAHDGAPAETHKPFCLDPARKRPDLFNW